MIQPFFNVTVDNCVAAQRHWRFRWHWRFRRHLGKCWGKSRRQRRNQRSIQRDNNPRQLGRRCRSPAGRWRSRKQCSCSCCRLHVLQRGNGCWRRLRLKRRNRACDDHRDHHNSNHRSGDQIQVGIWRRCCAGSRTRRCWRGACRACPRWLVHAKAFQRFTGTGIVRVHAQRPFQVKTPLLERVHHRRHPHQRQFIVAVRAQNLLEQTSGGCFIATLGCINAFS